MLGFDRAIIEENPKSWGERLRARVSDPAPGVTEGLTIQGTTAVEGFGEV